MATAEEKYSRLVETASAAPTAVPGDSVSTVGILPSVTRSNVQNTKLVKVLRGLTIVQLILAFVIVSAGIACIMASHYMVECYIGIPIWIGVVLIVCGILGVISSFKPENRCLLIAYFVLCIVGCVGAGVITIISAIHVFASYRYVFNHILWFLLTLTHLVCSIVASALICNMWSSGGCCGGPASYELPPVIYIQANAAPAQADGQQQIVFVPVQLHGNQVATQQQICAALELKK